ncbi:MAG: TIGR00153 family protein [Algicola sp.]|nr:TIGR00153 family protein [Algicola sp.]
MPANNFLNVFAKSPLKPIEEHIRIVHNTSEQLRPFFVCVFDKDWEAAEKVRKTISRLEKKADKLKRDVRLQLPRGLFLPVERTDLLELITQQDKIANRAKDIAGRIIGREMDFPVKMQKSLKLYIERCIDATGQASKAVNEFDDLLESGFRGREVELVEKIIGKIDGIEDDTDMMQIKLRRSLRTIEKDLDPVDVMFLYNIIDWIGDLADLAERVGARLEIMLAR